MHVLIATHCSNFHPPSSEKPEVTAGVDGWFAARRLAKIDSDNRKILAAFVAHIFIECCLRR